MTRFFNTPRRRHRMRRLLHRLRPLLGAALHFRLYLRLAHVPIAGGATIRREFGFVDDATVGGSEYDDLTSGAIPDATLFWPVTNVTVDKNVEQYTRNDEVRGRRAGESPRSFQAAPTMTVQVPAYRQVLEKTAKKTLGGTDTLTGAAPASITHTFAVLGFGSTPLPAVNATLVRDDLYQKMSGSVFQRWQANFPLDGEGTVEVELHGLYLANFVTAPPSAAITVSEDVMMLRDAQVFIDGSGTAVVDLQGFSFQFNNNTAPKHYAKRNVVTQTIGTPAVARKLWWPAERKLAAAQDVTGTINLGNVNAAQELASEYGQIQKFVFEVTGAQLGTTPPAAELFRFTAFGAAHTTGGAEALTARDDITSSFEFFAGFSSADNADIKVEVVNNLATAIT